MKNKRLIAGHIVIYCVYGLAALAGLLALINRAKYGIDFSDESWYVAEPYIVSEGAIPFVNNWTQAPGFTIPLALFFKAFTAITGGTEGIFLFSRILFAIWIFSIMLLIVILIGRKLDKAIPIVFVFALVSIVPHSLYDINYNTIGVVYLFLACTLIYMVPSEKENKIHVTHLIGGCVIARAIIGTPHLILPWLGIIIIYIARKQKAKLLSFLLGNAIMTIIVVGWCCIVGGTGDLIAGMQALIGDMAYFKITGHRNYENDWEYINELCIPVIYFTFLTLIFKMVKSQYCKIVLYGMLILSIACGGHELLSSGICMESVKWFWFVPIDVALLGDISPQYARIVKGFAITTVWYIIVYLFSSAGNILGFGSREYWLMVPCILGVLSLYYAIEHKLLAYIGAFVGIIVIGIGLIRSNYNFVYRDQEFPELNTVVESGIWKGCYTTPSRAENIVRLEQYIRSITNSADMVLLLDQVPFGYLMINGTACSPTTADPMLYTYGVDNPEIMFDYFSIVDKVPNKIIYIDFGRDEKLSIYNDWKFNNFVNKYYAQVQNYSIGEVTERLNEQDDADKASFW